MSILQDIYDNSYSPTEAIQKMPKSLRDKRWAFYGEVERVMGLAFMEQHWDNLCEAERFEALTNFRQGFLLGASLMLELL